MQDILGAIFTVASLVGFITVVMIHFRDERRKRQLWENPEQQAAEES